MEIDRRTREFQHVSVSEVHFFDYNLYVTVQKREQSIATAIFTTDIFSIETDKLRHADHRHNRGKFTEILLG